MSKDEAEKLLESEIESKDLYKFRESIKGLHNEELDELADEAIDQDNVKALSMLLDYGANKNKALEVAESIYPSDDLLGNVEHPKLVEIQDLIMDKDKIKSLPSSLENFSEKELLQVIKEASSKDLDQQISGKTLLTFAAEQGYFTAIENLLKLGVDPNSKDTSGKTSMNYILAHVEDEARENESKFRGFSSDKAQKAAKLLEQYNGKATEADSIVIEEKIVEANVIKAFKAAIAEDTGVARFVGGKVKGLFKTLQEQSRQVEINELLRMSLDKQGNTALHLTAKAGNMSLTQFLVDSGADLKALNFDNKKPVEVAARTVLQLSNIGNPLAEKTTKQFLEEIELARDKAKVAITYLDKYEEKTSDKDKHNIVAGLLILQDISKTEDFQKNPTSYLGNNKLELDHLQKLFEAQQDKESKYYQQDATGYLNYYDHDEFLREGVKTALTQVPVVEEMIAAVAPLDEINTKFSTRKAEINAIDNSNAALPVEKLSNSKIEVEDQEGVRLSLKAEKIKDEVHHKHPESNEVLVKETGTKEVGYSFEPTDKLKELGDDVTIEIPYFDETGKKIEGKTEVLVFNAATREIISHSIPEGLKTHLNPKWLATLGGRANELGSRAEVTVGTKVNSAELGNGKIISPETITSNIIPDKREDNVVTPTNTLNNAPIIPTSAYSDKAINNADKPILAETIADKAAANIVPGKREDNVATPTNTLNNAPITPTSAYGDKAINNADKPILAETISDKAAANIVPGKREDNVSDKREDNVVTPTNTLNNAPIIPTSAYSDKAINNADKPILAETISEADANIVADKREDIVATPTNTLNTVAPIVSTTRAGNTTIVPRSVKDINTPGLNIESPTPISTITVSPKKIAAKTSVIPTNPLNPMNKEVKSVVHTLAKVMSPAKASLTPRIKAKEVSIIQVVNGERVRLEEDKEGNFTNIAGDVKIKVIGIPKDIEFSVDGNGVKRGETYQIEVLRTEKEYLDRLVFKGKSLIAMMYAKGKGVTNLNPNEISRAITISEKAKGTVELEKEAKEALGSEAWETPPISISEHEIRNKKISYKPSTGVTR